MKIQICWTILRNFNYDDKLELKEVLFKDELIINKDSGQSVELSGKALDFLRNCFTRFSKKDNGIYLERVPEIFEPIGSVPWKNIERIVKIEETMNDPRKYISFDSWVCLWSLLTNEDYKRAYKYML